MFGIKAKNMCLALVMVATAMVKAEQLTLQTVQLPELKTITQLSDSQYANNLRAVRAYYGLARERARNALTYSIENLNKGGSLGPVSGSIYRLKTDRRMDLAWIRDTFNGYMRSGDYWVAATSREVIGYFNAAKTVYAIKQLLDLYARDPRYNGVIFGDAYKGMMQQVQIEPERLDAIAAASGTPVDLQQALFGPIEKGKKIIYSLKNIFTVESLKALADSQTELADFVQKVNSTDVAGFNKKATSAAVTNNINQGKPFAISQVQAQRMLESLAQGTTEWDDMWEAIQGFIWHMPDYVGLQCELPQNQGALLTETYVPGPGHDPVLDFDCMSYPDKPCLVTVMSGYFVNPFNTDSYKHRGSANFVNNLPYGAHFHTSYIFNAYTPAEPVLKSEYIRNPQNYPAVTALLLFMTNPGAPYLSQMDKNYVPGINNRGEARVNPLCGDKVTNTTDSALVGAATFGMSDAMGVQRKEVKAQYTGCEIHTENGAITCLYQAHEGGTANLQGCTGTFPCFPSTWLQCPTTLEQQQKYESGRYVLTCPAQK